MPGLGLLAIKSRKPGRIFEWFVHLNSIGAGVLLAAPGPSLTATNGLRSLYYTGWPEALIGVFVSMLGVMGCMALWVNGSKPYGSPRFRAIAAAGGVFLYGQVFASLLDDFFRNGSTLRLGLVTYGLMTAFCVYACYQSSRDAAAR